MLRRNLAVLVALSSVAAALSARASAGPALLPDGTWARAPYTAVATSAGGVLRAGAAWGDITPPPGAPMTGFYVARHCGTSIALEAAGKAQDKIRQVQEDPTEAPYAPSQCTASRVGPDTDGYAKTFPASDGRVGRLRAAAYVIDDGARKVAIVSVDLPGFFGEMHEAVARRIASTGITREGLLVSASHTHTGPGGYFQQNLGWAALGGDLLDPRIFEAITSGIVSAIVTADKRLQPAKIATGEAILDGHNGNRRSSQWMMNPQEERDVDPRNAPRLGMIRIDSVAGRPLGVITNYSSHGVIGNTINMWHTGDDKAWVGRLVQDGIRARAGLGPDDSVVAATLNGAQGDIGSASCTRPWSNMGGSDFNDLACMENAGARQAVRYVDVWQSLESKLSTDVTVDFRLDMVCFCGQEVTDDRYDPFDRGQHVPANDDPMYFNVANVAIQGEGRAPTTLFPGHHRRTPLLIGPPGVSPKSVRVQVLRVGDTAFASIPGEPTIQMGRRTERSVKSALAGLATNVWIAGLGNDHNAYFSTIQEYEAYQYEGGWSFYGQQSGNLVKRRLVELAEQMAQGRATPACTLERGCLENPDTTAVTAEPQALAPDVLPGEVVAQPANVERFQGTALTWFGGGPSAEWRPGEAIATLQAKDGNRWVDVATDLDPVIPLKYAKRYGRHRYSAMFDPIASQPEGTYRFVVTGRALAATPSTYTIYTITSSEFQVTRSTQLRLVKQSADGTWRVENPQPDRLKNFRYRAIAPDAWTVTGELDGVAFSASSAFTVPAGARLVVPPGGITDAFGNTNGAEVVITG